MIRDRRTRAVAAWRAALRETGRVEIEARRWLVVLLGAPMAGLGVLFLVAAVVVRDSGSDRLVMAAVGVLLCGVAALSLAALRRGPVLVVDRAGLHVGAAGPHIPWSELRAVSVVRVRLVPLVCAHVDRAFKRELFRDHGRVVRAAHAVDDTVVLGALLRADADHLAEWLDSEARQR